MKNSFDNTENHLLIYLLYLADNALVLGHRNSEWCGHGPVLEQDIAITNISLDLIGQSRNFYQYAAKLANDGSTEDSLAYLRDVRQFRNCLLLEQPNGDWGKTILRQFFFSAYQELLYKKLSGSEDEQVAAIAAKSLKEVNYHLRWSSEWVIRLGDGTDESKRRMEEAIEELWSYTGELFIPAIFETQTAASGIGVDVASLKNGWLQKVQDIFSQATLSMPAAGFDQVGGKDGRHSEYLGFILAELQYMQRAYPGNEW
jgi:ring-1,2-phenylacetyl-CoA epoxidase subunit PaaC